MLENVVLNELFRLLVGFDFLFIQGLLEQLRVASSRVVFRLNAFDDCLSCASDFLKLFLFRCYPLHLWKIRTILVDRVCVLLRICSVFLTRSGITSLSADRR